MKIDRFEEVAKDRFDVCLSLMLGDKNIEYSSGEDNKLYNFERAGEVARETPETALWGMFLKHFVSIQDQVENIELQRPQDVLPLSQIQEKITDAINYLVLLEALLIERLGCNDDDSV